jgi:hypothetical protein
MAAFWVFAPCSLVEVYQTTRRYNPEDSHLRTHHRENLKSYSENSALVPLRPLRITLFTQSSLWKDSAYRLSYGTVPTDIQSVPFFCEWFERDTLHLHVAYIVHLKQYDCFVFSNV